MKLNARYVSIGDFDDLYFQVSFENQHPAADYDPSAPTEPYLLLQRQFEDDDGGVCYLETHDKTALPGTSGFGSSSSLPPASPSRSIGQRIVPWRSSSSLQPDASARSSASFTSSSAWNLEGGRFCFGSTLRHRRVGVKHVWSMRTGFSSKENARPRHVQPGNRQQAAWL